jgi:uncharacterized protein YegP (UPF0339 family)
MPIRYEYDLDHNGEWRWIAVSETGATSAISPVGYASLQDCMHAVGLMRAPGGLAVLPGVEAQRQMAQPPDQPEKSLSRLYRRAPAAQAR